MPLPTLDIALRGATVALLLVLAASLFRGFGTVLAGRLAAAFALGSAAHAVTYSIGATSPVSIAVCGMLKSCDVGRSCAMTVPPLSLMMLTPIDPSPSPPVSITAIAFLL